MAVYNFDELIEVSHSMAKEKGWWPEGKKRTATEIFNNFHSELSEAWEEYRGGRMLPWHENCGQITSYAYESLDGFPPGPKPEGFGVELADFLIRLADWCGSLGLKNLEQRDAEIKPDYKLKPEEVIIFLHITTSNLFSLADGADATDGIMDDLLSVFSAEFCDKAKSHIETKKKEIVSRMVSRAVHVCLNQVESFMGNDNLWKVVNLKLVYNSSRSHRHGNKFA